MQPTGITHTLCYTSKIRSHIRITRYIEGHIGMNKVNKNLYILDI